MIFLNTTFFLLFLSRLQELISVCFALGTGRLVFILFKSVATHYYYTSYIINNPISYVELKYPSKWHCKYLVYGLISLSQLGCSEWCCLRPLILFDILRSFHNRSLIWLIICFKQIIFLNCFICLKRFIICFICFKQLVWNQWDLWWTFWDRWNNWEKWFVWNK